MFERLNIPVYYDRRRLNINVKVIFKITVALIRHSEGSVKIDRINASLILTIINELLQSLVVMESYATTR